MHILFVIKGSALNRGMNTGIENLAWSLATAGYQISILSGGIEPSQHLYNIPNNVTYFFTGGSGNPEAFIGKYCILSLRLKIDVVIGWVKNLAWLSFCKHRHKPPLFIANQGSMPQHHIPEIPLLHPKYCMSVFKGASKLGIRFRQTLSIIVEPYRWYSGLDHVVSISHAVQNKVLSTLKILPEKCSVIQRGIDTSFYDAPDREYLIQDCRPVRILFTGNVIETKGVVEIVHAASRLYHAVSFVFCGNVDPNFSLFLQHAFKPTNPKSEIIFTGPLDPIELMTCYRSADLFLLPSWSEGLGKSLLEAMACRLPVVVSDIAPFKEVVTSGVNGLMVKSRSSDQLADAISRFITDYDMRVQCGANARLTVENKFSHNFEVKQWRELIHAMRDHQDEPAISNK